MKTTIHLLIGLAALTLTGCPGGKVVRVYDGVEKEGRFINDWAYASYARGVEWEARGRPEEALQFYDEAIDQDPESVAIWTKIAALRCRLNRGDAQNAFDAGMERNAQYAPLWAARARCAAARGRGEEALGHARIAVALDPEDDETALLFVRLATAQGKHEVAERWLRSLVARSPRSRKVWQGVAAFAKQRDPTWLTVARARLETMQADLTAKSPAEKDAPPPAWREVDRALIAGSLDDARTWMRTAHLDIRLLAPRAIVVGRPALALEEAALRLGANPDDSDARMAHALAADLLGRGDDVVDTLATAPAAAEQLEAWGELLLAELLLRHVSREAAAMWLGIEPTELDGDGAPRVRLARMLQGKGT